MTSRRGRAALPSCREPGRVRYYRRTAYQDIDNPNAGLFRITTDDMGRAMQSFKSDVFKEASRLAKVTGRAFFSPRCRPD